MKQTFPRDQRIGVYKNIPWSESHGVADDTLGAVEDYIELIKRIKPANALVIGSGSGFVPYVILDNSDAEVVLVDALIAETGNGSPMDFTRTRSAFYSSLNDFGSRYKFVESLSKDFFRAARERLWHFDFIFIDGDHSSSAVIVDFQGALDVASTKAAILFHDTNLPWVGKIADKTFGSWRNIKKGAGTGVSIMHPDSSKLAPPSRPILSEVEFMKSELKRSCNGNRWNYLQNEAFKDRFEYAEAFLLSQVGDLEGLSLLELGGNPSPFSAYLIGKGHAIRAVNIEPFIAPSSQADFDLITKNDGKVLSTFDELKDAGFDIVVAFGIDLSLARDYVDLRKAFNDLRKFIRSSRIAVLEAPDYTPSRLLQHALSIDGSVIETKDIAIPLEVGEASISPAILQRRVLFVSPSKANRENSVAASLLPAVGRLYSLDGSPVFENTFGVGRWEVDEIAYFLGYPTEMSDSIKYCWLPNRILLSLSRPASRVSFDLLPGSFRVPFSNSSALFTISTEGDCLIIETTLAGKLYQFIFGSLRLDVRFEYFTPSESGNSDDHRRLSYAVTSMLVS